MSALEELDWQAPQGQVFGFHSKDPFIMCQTILKNPDFFKFLLPIDQDHAATIRLRRCSHCDGPLHQANYERKPRDAPSIWIEEKIRFSFCCGHCRRRCTPASVRFMGRRVYWEATVLLATALCHGLALRRSNPLSRYFGVPVQTLQRWLDILPALGLRPPLAREGRRFLLRSGAAWSRSRVASVGSCCWRHGCTAHFTGEPGVSRP